MRPRLFSICRNSPRPAGPASGETNMQPSPESAETLLAQGFALGSVITVLGCPRFLSRLVYSAQDGRTGSRVSSKGESGGSDSSAQAHRCRRLGQLLASSHVAQTAAMRQEAVPHLPARPSKVCGVRLRTQINTLPAKLDFGKCKNPLQAKYAMYRQSAGISG
jgi:hypothetical protein